MKIIFTLLCFLISCPLVRSQDTISYSQESDTLVKQRFMDRYENVFMTKEPTRHMFKVGLSQYYQELSFPLADENIFNYSSLTLGYEFKVLPAFSIALSTHIPAYGLNLPMYFVRKSIVYDAQVRWFPQMRKKIRAGTGANNFSGNYVALNYTRRGKIEGTRQIGLKVGFQRRFLSFGFMDFAVALQQDNPWFYYGLLDNWSLTSQATVGFAIGDWKKSVAPPLCDVLLCDENIENQWKIRLPELTFGYYLNRIRVGGAFEQKIKALPVSLNFQLDIGLNRGFVYVKSNRLFDVTQDALHNLNMSTEFTQVFSIQPRYYFLQKSQQLKGRIGNGLSGVYAGVNSAYNFYSGRHSFMRGPDGPTRHVKQNILLIGPMIGIQQRVLRHGYVDLNISYNRQRDFSSSVNSFGLKANLGVGLAF